MAMLRRGLYGEPVRILQEKLGVNADGVFGVGTETALLEYQKSNGLSADGIAGPDTFTQMGLHELVLLHRPIRGEQVKKLQQVLGLDADGIFGAGTEAAVKKFQAEHGLDADGIAGPNTLALMPEFAIPEEKVAASVVTEATPTIEPAAVEQAKAEPPPPPPPEGFVAKVGSTVSNAAHAVEDKVANVGKSIWGTVKSIF